MENDDDMTIALRQGQNSQSETNNAIHGDHGIKQKGIVFHMSYLVCNALQCCVPENIKRR